MVHGHPALLNKLRAYMAPAGPALQYNLIKNASYLSINVMHADVQTMHALIT